MRKATLLRLGLFLMVALIHGVVLFCFVIAIEPSRNDEEAPLTVMKLLDIEEELPPPPPRPPPPRPLEPQPPAAENVVESIAENMTVVEEVPEEQVLTAPGTVPSVSVPGPSTDSDTYLPQNKISKVPVFPEAAIRKVLNYPPIARRSGIEGSVILELFIDRSGVIQRVIILRESPPGRGFGEAAEEALLGQQCIPAESNGVAVAVRYRYPVRFQLR